MHQRALGVALGLVACRGQFGDTIFE